MRSRASAFALPGRRVASTIRAFQRTETSMIRTNVATGTWIATALLMAAAALPAVVSAEEPTIDQQVQMIRSLTEAQRQATMAANLELTDAEGTKFWPLYREYRNDMAKINDKFVALIKDYAENFEAMTDEKAKVYTKDYIQVQKDRIDLKSKYVGKFDKVLSPINTARVLQIETKLDSMIDAGLAKTIPLVTAQSQLQPKTP
jgi:Spy/CpxP family protein refolding chaperone